jgi:hypothetical protein
MNKFVCIITAALLVCSCTLYESVTKGEKVAQIGRAALYKTDLEKIIPKDIAPQDSAALVRQYIDSWAIKQLMLQKAEEQLPKSEKDVAQLLEDYRVQLLVFRYENKFVEERLDTIVKGIEREEYYNAHQGSFVGRNGVFKGRLVKMQNSSPNLQVMRKLAKGRDAETLEELEALLQRSELKLYGAALTDAARDVRHVDLRRAAVAVGSEGRGLSDAFLSRCDGEIIIPMRPDSESLNAAVAASILMWEIARNG